MKTERRLAKMMRHVVYYLLEGSPTPRRLLARRGETPDACVETALERLETMPIDLSKVTVLVVSVGDDTYFGGPIDVSMATVIPQPRRWALDYAIIV